MEFILPRQSEELGELFGALAKAQGEMQAAVRNNKNPFYNSKYAPLEEVVKCSREALSKNGLCVIQRIVQTDTEGKTSLYTCLAHSSGQWMESVMPLRPDLPDSTSETARKEKSSNNNIQKLGSYISYCRRYTYASMVGVVTDDEDDDGEKAMGRFPQVKKGNVMSRPQPPKASPPKLISAADLKKLESALTPDTKQMILDKYKDKGITSLQEIPDSHVKKLFEFIAEHETREL